MAWQTCVLKLAERLQPSNSLRALEFHWDKRRGNDPISKMDGVLVEVHHCTERDAANLTKFTTLGTSNVTHQCL